MLNFATIMFIFSVLNLFSSDSKLDSYLQKFLTPVLQGIKDHPALLAIEVINELEGIVDAGKSNSELELTFNVIILRNFRNP